MILFLFLAFVAGYCWFRATVKVDTIVTQCVNRFESEQRVRDVVRHYSID